MNVTMYKVAEYFYSLQGEGTSTGEPSIFIRLSGCNLACPFCDTDHSGGWEMSADALFDVCVNLSPKCRNVVITGGEPLLQDLTQLAARFKQADYTVSVETNGTVELNCESHVFLTVSPKFDNPHKIVIQECYEVKLLSCYLDRAEQVRTKIKAHHYFVMPVDYGDPVRNNEERVKAVNFVLRNPEWKLCLQLHKILGIK